MPSGEREQRDIDIDELIERAEKEDIDEAGSLRGIYLLLRALLMSKGY